MQTSSESLRLLVRISASGVSLHGHVRSEVDAGNTPHHQNRSALFCATTQILLTFLPMRRTITALSLWEPIQ